MSSFEGTGYASLDYCRDVESILTTTYKLSAEEAEHMINSDMQYLLSLFFDGSPPEEAAFLIYDGEALDYEEDEMI